MTFYWNFSNSTYTNAPYTGYYKLLNPGINLRDADLIKDVLIKDHFSFHKNEQDFNKKFDPLAVHNPFATANEGWRKGRAVLSPTLTLFKVRNLHPLVVDSCEKLTNYLKTIPPNKDVEAKVVCIILLVFNLFFLDRFFILDHFH